MRKWYQNQGILNFYWEIIGPRLSLSVDFPNIFLTDPSEAYSFQATQLHPRTKIIEWLHEYKHIEYTAK